jgi:GH24 family phage-related lysozyme (muramidase)
MKAFPYLIIFVTLGLAFVNSFKKIEPVSIAIYDEEWGNKPAPASKRVRDTWMRIDGQPDFFRIVITETKRREGMGKRTRELEMYSDGGYDAIGYGNHVRYLSLNWKAVIRQQGNKVSEAQARQMMYETFDEIDTYIGPDLPNLNEAQRWAVKSLAFNWGYGNVKKSGLWKHLKAGNTGPSVEKAWMRTQVKTSNHQKSRGLELDLYHGRYDSAVAKAKQAYRDLEKRGDFKKY